MLLRLVLFAMLAGAAWGLATWWRRQRTRRLPAVPERWLLLEPVDARMREGLELRERVARLVRRPSSGLTRELVVAVDDLLEGVAELVELRLEVARHLGTLRRAEGAGGAEGRATAKLAEREAHLEHEAERAIVELRDIYADLLGAVADPREQGSVASARTRRAVDELKVRVEAERDVRAVAELEV